MAELGKRFATEEEMFEGATRTDRSCCDFGWALCMLRQGLSVQRKGWNGKGMFLLLVPGTPQCELKPASPYSSALRARAAAAGGQFPTQVDINPHVDMYTADGKMQPGWLCSQTDMLAEDWCIA